MTEIAVNTTIELDDYEIDKRVIHAAAEELLRRNTPLKYDDLRAALHAAVDRRAEDAVAAAFDRGIQPVDGYGRPQGDPIPVPEYIAQAIKGWLDQHVDRDGKPWQSGSFSSGRTTRGEYLLRKFAIEGLDKIAREEIVKIRSETKKNIAGRLSEIVMKELAGR